jgi:hypothetical protein
MIERGALQGQSNLYNVHRDWGIPCPFGQPLSSGKIEIESLEPRRKVVCLWPVYFGKTPEIRNYSLFTIEPE